MRLKFLAVVCCFLICSGCAEIPTDPDALAYYNEIDDPLEPLNRKIFDFNQAVDTAILKPVARGYHAVAPEVVRDSVNSFLANLGEPVNFVNSVLQFNFKCSVHSVLRFFFNTAFGLFGLHDTASDIGLSPCKNDFGVTLAKYGVPKGPMLVLPIVGQKHMRDIFGSAGDYFMSPLTIYGLDKNPHSDFWDIQTYTRPVVSGIATREKILNLTDMIEKDSLDLYSSYREKIYRVRQKEINELLGLSDAEKQQSYDFEVLDDDF